MFSEKTAAVLRIRAAILQAARCCLNQNDYVEVQGPIITPSVEDLPGSFEVKYFDKKAYLTQGLQPYANAFVASLGKIYTVAPAFRAEKVKTKRHLTEYWRIEVAQRCDMVTIMKVQEELLEHICHLLSKEAKEELKCLDRGIEDLNRVKPPFPKVTYDEAINILQKDGLNISWGQRIEWELENHLSRKFDRPFFLTGFPVGIDTFFFKSYTDQPELTLSADLLAPEGYGEISGGGQMIDEKRLLLQKMAEEKIEKSSQEWYMHLVSFDCIPQSGFAVGLERLVQWICKLGDIKKATAFPRTFDSIYP